MDDTASQFSVAGYWRGQRGRAPPRRAAPARAALEAELAQHANGQVARLLLSDQLVALERAVEQHIAGA